MKKKLQLSNNFKKTDNIPSICIRKAEGVKGASFTIAIPTFKRPDLLKEALDSAFAQQYSKPYIVLVVDNNKERNDETEKLITSYTQKNLSYYKNSQNVGMAGNWNKLFQITTTQWMVMLHDDDLISPFYLSTMEKAITIEATFIKPNIPKFYKSSQEGWDLMIQSQQTTIPSLIRRDIYDCIYGCPIGAPSHVTFNTAKVKKLGGFDDSRYPCIDYWFTVLACKYGNVYILPIALGAYRVTHNESLKIDTMIMFWNKRFEISQNLLANFGCPSWCFNLLKWFTFGFFVKDINRKYRMDVKPTGIAYWIPTRFQILLLRIVSKVVRKTNI